MRKRAGGTAEKSDFLGGSGTQIGGYNPFTTGISYPKYFDYICDIMIKKFNIIASHLSSGAMQEAPSYEMGISKYARMRQEMLANKKINMMAEAYRKAEESEPEMGMIMPMVKK